MDTPGRIAELERKFSENPRRYFAALANEYRRQGELERAIELCERHLDEQRNHLSGHVVLAQALVDSGRDEAAWEPLHTALDLDPENFIALRLLGDLSVRAGDAGQARAYYFRALEIEPRSEQIIEALKSIRQLRDTPAAAAAQPSQPDITQPPAEATDVRPAVPLEELPPWGEEVATGSAPTAPGVGEPPPEVTEADVEGQAAPPGEEEAVPLRSYDPSELAVMAEWDFSAWETDAQAESTTLPSPDAPGEAEEAATHASASAEESPQEPSIDALWGDVMSLEETASEGPSESAAETVIAAGEPELPEGGPASEVVAADEPHSRPTLVSETMVELYLQQGHTALALQTLRELVDARPEDERLRDRLAELEAEEAAPPRETVRDLFARLGRARHGGGEAARALADAFAAPATQPQEGPLTGFFEETGAAPAPVRDDEALSAALTTPQDDPASRAVAFEQWLRDLRAQ